MKSILLFFGIALLFVLPASTSAQNAVPAFSFTQLSGEPLTRENLEADKAVIFMFFDPYCDHCDQQAEWIAAEADAFANTQIVFVTTEPEADATQAFIDRHFGEVELEHLYFAIDTNFMFDGYFDGYYTVPSILVYNARGKRTRIFDRETPVEKLLQALDQ